MCHTKRVLVSGYLHLRLQKPPYTYLVPLFHASSFPRTILPLLFTGHGTAAGNMWHTTRNLKSGTFCCCTFSHLLLPSSLVAVVIRPQASRWKGGQQIPRLAFLCFTCLFYYERAGTTEVPGMFHNSGILNGNLRHPAAPSLANCRPFLSAVSLSGLTGLRGAPVDGVGLAAGFDLQREPGGSMASSPECVLVALVLACSARGGNGFSGQAAGITQRCKMRCI